MTDTQTLEQALASYTTDAESLWVLVNHQLSTGTAFAVISTWCLVDNHLKANWADQAHCLAVLDRYEELVSE